MQPFIYAPLPARVRFARGGRTQVGEEMRAIGRQRAMVISTPTRVALAEEVSDALGGQCAGILATARLHTPIEVTTAALDSVRQAGADCTVAVGGGSAIGLAKAIAVRMDVPQIALPTTYAGSEMTDVHARTEDGVKHTAKDPRALPASVIYDVDYTLGLPVDISVTSGFNALAHAVEALYAVEKNPITHLQCLDAAGALAAALPAILDDPGDVAARERALYGAFLCGLALGSTSVGLHHKLCHTLGGSFDLPHAPTHTVMLPHTAGFNAAAAPELDPLRQVFGAETLGGGLWDFAKCLGAPVSLAGVGMREDDLERAADIAVARPYRNPRAFDRADILALLRQAYAGGRPSA